MGYEARSREGNFDCRLAVVMVKLKVIQLPVVALPPTKARRKYQREADLACPTSSSSSFASLCLVAKKVDQKSSWRQVGGHWQWPCAELGSGGCEVTSWVVALESGLSQGQGHAACRRVTTFSVPV